MEINNFSISKSDLNYQSSVPLYSQLVSIINQKISNGDLKVGDLIPTEISLCKKLELSRSTVRKAMAQLEYEGKILRKPRRGTFICKPKLRRSLNNLYNFSNEMHELNLHPSSSVLHFEVITPSLVISKQLEISEYQKVYKIIRLRMVDQKPLLLETAYIPVNFCSNLTIENLSDSLYAMINEYTGAQPMEAMETYEAVILKEKEAKYLECNVGIPAFKITRTSRNTNGDIFEYTTILAPGDRNRYEITLHKNNIFYTKIV